MVLSEKVPCNNGKDWRYIAAYHVDGETIIALFIKTPKNIFSYDVSQYDRNSAYTMSFNVSEVPEWVFQYRNIWNEVESQLFKKRAMEPIKFKDIHGKLNMERTTLRRISMVKMFHMKRVAMQ